MNQHLAPIDLRRLKKSRELVNADRETIVKTMAEHLVAAILNDALDTSKDIDVISCLLDTPERFQSRVVLNHMDDAMYAAKQILIAREMGES